jgi:hypothetical protein
MPVRIRATSLTFVNQIGRTISHVPTIYQMARGIAAYNGCVYVGGVGQIFAGQHISSSATTQSNGSPNDPAENLDDAKHLKGSTEKQIQVQHWIGFGDRTDVVSSMTIEETSQEMYFVLDPYIQRVKLPPPWSSSSSLTSSMGGATVPQPISIQQICGGMHGYADGAIKKARFGRIQCIAHPQWSPNGIMIVDKINNAIRRIYNDRVTTLYCGDNDDMTLIGIAITNDGGIYMLDSTNRLYRLDK